MVAAQETVTCKCGHTDTLRACTLATPWGVFRCPACKWTWERVLTTMGGGKTCIVIREYTPCNREVRS